MQTRIDGLSSRLERLIATRRDQEGRIQQADAEAVALVLEVQQVLSSLGGVTMTIYGGSDAGAAAEGAAAASVATTPTAMASNASVTVEVINQTPAVTRNAQLAAAHDAAWNALQVVKRDVAALETQQVKLRANADALDDALADQAGDNARVARDIDASQAALDAGAMELPRVQQQVTQTAALLESVTAQVTALQNELSQLDTHRHQLELALEESHRDTVRWRGLADDLDAVAAVKASRRRVQRAADADERADAMGGGGDGAASAAGASAAVNGTAAAPRSGYY